MYDIINLIKKEMYKDFKKDINKGTFEEFVSSKSKKELLSNISFSYAILGSEKEIDINTISKLSKKNLNQHYLNIYKDCIYSSFYIIGDLNIMQIKGILKELNNGYGVFNLDTSNYSIDFFLKMQIYGYANIKYDDSSSSIEIYFPKEIIIEIKKLLSDKNFMKEVNKNCKIYNNLVNLIDVYGIVKENDLFEIYNKTFKPLNKDVLKVVIYTMSLPDNNIEIINNKDTTYFSSSSISEYSNAIDFYNSIDSTIDYRLFKEQEILEITECFFMYELKSFPPLIDEIIKITNNNDDDYLNEIKVNIIDDYFFSYRIDQRTAKLNYNKNISNFYDVTDLIHKISIHGKLNTLSKDFPLYIYRGYTKKEYDKLKAK